MKIASVFTSFTLASFCVLTASAQQASTADHQQHEHHHMNIQPVQPEYPRLGKAQENAQGSLLSLEQFESIARESNPTLRQAEAEIRAAKARQQQAGLYPNPMVGYTSDEVRGGSVGGGKQGFFVQQTIVTGGKLGLSRSVYGRETKLAELEAEEQQLRVTTAVKIAFTRVLAAQELLETRRDLARIAQDTAETQRGLMNTGQADETEVLDAEVAAQRARLASRMEENTLREEWRALAAVVGQPEMPFSSVSGDLAANWPQLNEEEIVATIARESPAIRIADATATRESALLAQRRRQPFPDVLVRAGMEHNNDLLGNGRPKGWEGLGEVGVQIPIFDRNQGAVAAARAELERAGQEKRRVALALRDRAAATVDEYANARLMAVEYRDEMLPRAKKAYTLMVEKYGSMLASYPRVLEAQKRLFELHTEYITALEGVWTNGIALQGFLLTDGLEAPARPGEVDRPVRETNMPVPERTMSPGEVMPQP